MKAWIPSKRVPTHSELDALVARFFVRVEKLDATLRENGWIVRTASVP